MSEQQIKEWRKIERWLELKKSERRARRDQQRWQEVFDAA